MSSNASVSGELKTEAVLTTKEGKQINLGHLDRRVGIRADVFGKEFNLTFPWTPRLWFYKYVHYPYRKLKYRKEN